MAAKFTFAVKDENHGLIHISEVDNCNDSILLCQDCLAELIAVTKVKKITQHFRHKSADLGCSASYESSLHKAAKAVVLRSNSIFIPGCGDVNYQTPVAEKGFERFKPDVTVQASIGEIYIEIVVSNHPSAEKEFFYASTKGVCLVIDLSTIDRDVDVPTLENLVLSNSGCKRVISAKYTTIPSITDSSDNLGMLAILGGLGLFAFIWLKKIIIGTKKRRRHRI